MQLFSETLNLYVMDKIKSFLEWLKRFPFWLRATLLLLVGGILLVLSSCGQTVRVVVKDTPNGVSISTSQNKADSSGTNIKIEPTINFSK